MPNSPRDAGDLRAPHAPDAQGAHARSALSPAARSLAQHAALTHRFASSPVTVAIIGLGYVGLPLAHAFHSAGCRVIGYDTDENKAAAFAARPPQPYLKHLGTHVYTDLGLSDRFLATTDPARLAEADAVLVCVPTPLGPEHEPDLSFVVKSAETIGKTLKRGQLIVLESTTYPGTTRNEFLAPLKAAQPTWTPGVDYFVAFSPEREDPGNKQYTTVSIPKVVGGLDAASGAAACALYGRAFRSIVPTSSAEVAESAKILENTFRAVNIALVNELKVVFAALGIDIWEVIEAASTKPFGFMPFYPGPGLGGHCIPIDPFYLSWLARRAGTPSEFIELTGRVNTTMPGRVIDKLAAELAQRAVPIRGARVLVLGLAYKPDIDDQRESPSFELIEHLKDLGAEVDYSDPLIPEMRTTRKHDLQMSSIPLSAETIASYACILIATNHTIVDYALIAEHARFIVDTRNAMAQWAKELGARLVKA
ncbi:nucleotide sugar dehydrogenase [soil metagenome]